TVILHAAIASATDLARITEMRRSVWALSAAAWVLALAACTGNGSSVSTTGAITAFGSVVVNGIHYDTTTATVTLNGASVTEAQLAVGQIARIGGNHNNTAVGNADTIDVDDRLVGPITSTDAVRSSLVALGQTVTVNSGTSFGPGILPSALAGLAVGDVIQVAGFVAADGHVAATRIDRQDSATFQVTGKVVGLDTTGKTFTINLLKVDYSTAVVSDFTAGAPAEGDVVE